MSLIEGKTVFFCICRGYIPWKITYCDIILPFERITNRRINTKLCNTFSCKKSCQLKSQTFVMIIKLKLQYNSQKEFRVPSLFFFEMKIWRKGSEFPGQQRRCASSEKTLKGLTMSRESPCSTKMWQSSAT